MESFHQIVTLCDKGNRGGFSQGVSLKHVIKSLLSSHRGKPTREKMTPEMDFYSLVIREMQTNTTVRYDFVFPEIIKY